MKIDTTKPRLPIDRLKHPVQPRLPRFGGAVARDQEKVDVRVRREVDTWLEMRKK